MSRIPDFDPESETAAPGALEVVIVPRARDIGAFEVRRALPAPERQLVGPFVFFDQMGPVELVTGAGLDVQPHPHIGLATITYLVDGEFRHRDSLGSNQVIRPGDVNWMVAGRGVTHSERSDADARSRGGPLLGIQTWVALPEDAEDGDPLFEHYGAGTLPLLEEGGRSVRLMAGHAWGERAPTRVHTDLFYADAELAPGARLPLPTDHEDRAVHVLRGSIEVAGETLEAGRMAVFHPGDAIALRAGERGARVILLGGATLEGPRYIWWNFVASSEERIEEARRAWHAGDFEHGRFRLPPGDTDEFVPAPEPKGRPRRLGK